MAKNDAQKVTVGKPAEGGAVHIAESVGGSGATAPTDATTALDGKFKKMGYLSDSGVTNAVETDSEEIKAWGGDTVLVTRSSRKETFAWTFIQALDAEVLKETYGPDNVEGTDVITVKHNNKPLPHRAFAFDIVLSGDKLKRIYVPDGQITEVGDVVYKDDELVGYEVTMTAYPDEQGNTAYEWITAKKGKD